MVSGCRTAGGGEAVQQSGCPGAHRTPPQPERSPQTLLDKWLGSAAQGRRDEKAAAMVEQGGQPEAFHAA